MLFYNMSQGLKINNIWFIVSYDNRYTSPLSLHFPRHHTPLFLHTSP